MSSIYRCRLTEDAEETVSRFVSSIKEDARIFEEDIDGTEAHDIMLCEQGIITREQLQKILSALEKLRREKRRGTITLDPRYEDVHEFIEEYVIREAGLEAGGTLHTGRSRNDQIALDIRMNLRRALTDISSLLLNLMETLLTRADEQKRTAIMFYTHTQHAQVGSLSHYFTSFVDAFLRDFHRLQDCYARVNLSPLGAGPIGGTSLPVDRKRTASLLGFDGIVENSIDAISSRDFMLEAASILAVLMSQLSRLSEDFILWSSAEFRYLEIDDRYSSVSSVMPQKKNPTVLELIRAKTGVVYGGLMSLLSVVKGLPTGYSSDLQETKPALWNSIDAVKSSLGVVIGVIATVKIDVQRMTDVLSESYAFAVDLAESLAAKTTLSFREAHMAIGQLIREMISSDTKPEDLTPEYIVTIVERSLGKRVTVDRDLVQSVIDTEKALAGRKPLGSPSPREVRRILKARRKSLNDSRKKLEAKVERLNQAKKRLSETVEKYR